MAGPADAKARGGNPGPEDREHRNSLAPNVVPDSSAIKPDVETLVALERRLVVDVGFHTKSLFGLPIFEEGRDDVLVALVRSEVALQSVRRQLRELAP